MIERFDRSGSPECAACATLFDMERDPIRLDFHRAWPLKSENGTLRQQASAGLRAPAIRRDPQAADSAASPIRSATSTGWAMNTAWLAATLRTVAPIRSAMNPCAGGGII